MINFSKVKILIGNKKIENKILLPYDEKICKFLSDFSNELNNFKGSSKFPDILSLAFFCRKGNIIKLKKNFLASLDNKRLPLGLIFHITPSNIPTNFVYSLVFGLINGNSNIVKVTSKNFEQVNIILKVMNQTLKKHDELKKMITVVKYNN